jgi:hypothetical protein
MSAYAWFSTVMNILMFQDTVRYQFLWTSLRLLLPLANTTSTCPWLFLYGVCKYDVHTLIADFCVCCYMPRNFIFVSVTAMYVHYNACSDVKVGNLAWVDLSFLLKMTHNILKFGTYIAEHPVYGGFCVLPTAGLKVLVSCYAECYICGIA